MTYWNLLTKYGDFSIFFSKYGDFVGFVQNNPLQDWHGQFFCCQVAKFHRKQMLAQFHGFSSQ
jgi:hypothetical protein